jgi:large subunit ribosomal protein L21
MPKVVPGDILRLNRASVLGSRDFTLRAAEPIKASTKSPSGIQGTCLVDGQSVGLIPGAIKKRRYVDERLFVCRARVLGTESEPMRVMKKTKARQRHVKHVRSKHKYTVLKITEITVNDPAMLDTGHGYSGEASMST